MNSFGSAPRVDDNAFLDAQIIFDHVLEVTNQPQLHLIGFSKGTTIAMMLLSSRVEYNEKVRLLILIAPVTYISTPIPLIRILMDVLEILTHLVSLFWNHRIQFSSSNQPRSTHWHD